LGIPTRRGSAGAIEWPRAVGHIPPDGPDAGAADATLGALVKYREDGQRVRERGIGDLVREAVAGGA
ncbi:MAG: hypothetical protein PV358_06620, partial [Acidimicrobiales bacterium]|nr:hypothetical protein [Acidimicrobiales bacterium]